MNFKLEKERRAKIFAEHFSSRPTNQNGGIQKSSDSNKTPLINQVQRYFQHSIDRITFHKVFNGKSMKWNMVLLFTVQTLYIALSGYLLYHFRQYFFESKYVAVKVLFNCFHIVGLCLFDISASDNYAIATILATGLCEYWILGNYLFGGLLVQLLRAAYVLFLVTNYLFPKSLSPPNTNRQLLNSLSCVRYSYSQLLRFRTLFKRLKRLSTFLIPTFFLLKLIEYSYNIEGVARVEYFALIAWDIFVNQQTTKLFRIITKYKVKDHLLKQEKQLPLFLHAVSNQFSRTYEIQALLYISSDPKVKLVSKNLALNFRLDQLEAPTVHDVVLSYIRVRHSELATRILETSQEILKLSNTHRSLTTLLQDLGVVPQYLMDCIRTWVLSRQLQSDLDFFVYLSDCAASYMDTDREIPDLAQQISKVREFLQGNQSRLSYPKQFQNLQKSQTYYDWRK